MIRRKLELWKFYLKCLLYVWNCNNKIILFIGHCLYRRIKTFQFSPVLLILYPYTHLFGYRNKCSIIERSQPFVVLQGKHNNREGIVNAFVWFYGFLQQWEVQQKQRIVLISIYFCSISEYKGLQMCKNHLNFNTINKELIINCVTTQFSFHTLNC